MVEKVESIADIREKLGTEVTKPMNAVEAVEEDKVLDPLSTDSRSDIVAKLDKFLLDNNIELHEALLGFSDLFSAVLVSGFENMLAEKELAEATERINTLRTNMCECLNENKDRMMSEDTIVLLSLLAESTEMAIKTSMIKPVE